MEGNGEKANPEILRCWEKRDKMERKGNARKGKENVMVRGIWILF